MMRVELTYCPSGSFSSLSAFVNIFYVSNRRADACLIPREMH